MNHARKGFTLVELMLAMSFLSVLLIAIALTIIQIGNMYNRGLTLKEVNQAGRTVSADLQRTISGSATFDISGASTRFINQPWGGRLCTGQYSYIWNYGTTLDLMARTGTTRANSNLYDPNVSTNTIRFIKVEDSSSFYCTAANGFVSPVGVVELLRVGDRDLALHSFRITSDPLARDAATRQALYAISFIIGTNDQAALASNSSTCRPPRDTASNVNYCSVNQFDIVVRTSNAVQ